MQLFVRSEEGKQRTWHGVEHHGHVVVQGAADALLEDCVEKGTFRDVCDFDDHVADVGSDWTNTALLS